MPKRLEDFDFSPPTVVFSAEDFEKMAAALGLDEMDIRRKSSLQRICDFFLISFTSWKLAPSLPAIRSQLKKLSDSAAKMLTVLNAPHLGTKTDLPARQAAEELVRQATSETDWDVFGDDFAKLADKLLVFHNSAESALSSLPKGKGGRPNSAPLEILIPVLDKIFAEITGTRGKIITQPYPTGKAKRSYGDKNPQGREEFRGVFLDFAEAFLLPLKDHFPMQRQTLGSEIKRILAAHRKREA